MPVPSSGKAVLKIKITLRGIRPPVWRRVLVPESYTLADFHWVVQEAMGWMNAHLYAFEMGEASYSDPDMLDDTKDSARITLKKLWKDGINKFEYVYDMGDCWVHSVLIEDREVSDPKKSYPLCVAGRRHCPPEDCGGPYGYAEFLEVLADPNHPDYEEKLEWVDGEFDPDAFTVAETNARLRR